METQMTPCFSTLSVHVCVLGCIFYVRALCILYQFVLCCDCVLWNIICELYICIMFYIACRLAFFVLYELCATYELRVLGFT